MKNTISKKIEGKNTENLKLLDLNKEELKKYIIENTDPEPLTEEIIDEVLSDVKGVKIGYCVQLDEDWETGEIGPHVFICKSKKDISKFGYEYDEDGIPCGIVKGKYIEDLMFQDAPGIGSEEISVESINSGLVLNGTTVDGYLILVDEIIEIEEE